MGVPGLRGADARRGVRVPRGGSAYVRRSENHVRAGSPVDRIDRTGRTDPTTPNYVAVPGLSAYEVAVAGSATVNAPVVSSGAVTGPPTITS